MTRDEGVYPITIASGETRYQAVAKIKGSSTLLGWWTTPELAMKKYKEVTGHDYSNDLDPA
jgi:hypothetical protein